MPNWVFNTISDYKKDVYEKYKGEDSDIDFNKVIPEPEEITNTVSGSTADTAKRVYEYKLWKKDNTDDYSNPLRQTLNNLADRSYKQVGELCITNSDKSLNELLKSKDNKYIADSVERYNKIFGNKTISDIRRDGKLIEACDKYCKYENEEFQKYKETSLNSKYSKATGEILSKYDTLEDYGKQLTYLKEKYGYDNWYDWRNANWGVKWNAGNTNYDEGIESLSFDTPWGIPYPILAKIAQDNPQMKSEVYSEEETGWFEESELKDGKMYIKAEGEYLWKEETGEDGKTFDVSTTKRKEVNPPVAYTYDQAAKNSIKEVELVNNMVKNIAVNF